MTISKKQGKQRKIISLFSLLLCSQISFADEYKNIYPFKPFESEEIVKRIKYLSEDSLPIINFHEIHKSGLHVGQATHAPWSGPYWALKEGMIANPYMERNVLSYFNYIPLIDDIDPYHKRSNYVLNAESRMSEEELAKLAPSEKYDLLLGNNLDLSNRVWDFINKWKEDMKWLYMTSIDLPGEDYEIEKKNYIVANWEGICHGWAPASGVVPQPMKTVYAKLPDGRRIPFYPEDIKGLISLTWANSIVQDNVLSEGLRCKRRFPSKDRYGRYYDKIKENDNFLPRCADIHPAVMHLSLINVMGKQGRSFVVDKSSTISVSNQPVAAYSFKYFHPLSGSDLSNRINLIDYNTYRKSDPFKDSRHPEIKYIIGVESTIKYADWTMIKKPDDKKYSKNKYSDLVSLYDLEFDSKGNIIGGQWRGFKDLRKAIMAPFNNDSSDSEKENLTRPDFLWVVPKNYQNYFKPISKLEKWSITSGERVPESWTKASISAHSFVYETSKHYGNYELCKVKNNDTGEVKEVPCEFKYPRPQPLINVVDQLIELSK